MLLTGMNYHGRIPGIFINFFNSLLLALCYYLTVIISNINIFCI